MYEDELMNAILKYSKLKNSNEIMTPTQIARNNPLKSAIDNLANIAFSSSLFIELHCPKNHRCLNVRDIS
jgi:hypothetical protein